MSNWKFLGENWWQGVGVIAGAVLTVISIILTIRYNKNKKLSYKVIYSEELLNISKQFKEDLKITYRDLEIESFNVLKIQIINNGGIPIRKNDFDGDMELYLNGCKVLLSVEVVDRYPENLKVEIEPDEGKVIISPLLLNPKESFSLNMTFDGISRENNLSARIEGITDIRQINQSRLIDTIDYIYVSVALFVFVTTQIVVLILKEAGFVTASRVLSNFTAIIFGALVPAAISYYIKKNKKLKSMHKA